MKIINFVKCALVFTCVFSSLGVFSAGFEKTVMWGAKWSGLAGAATGAVDNGDSVFYNPAGLVANGKSDIAANYSPLRIKTSGAQTADDEKLDSGENIKHMFGLTGKHNISKDFALGVGVYVSGGTGASFEEIDYSDINSNFAAYKPDVESAVQIIEVGIGGAYRVSKNWSLGATWRISMAEADFASASLAAGNTLLIGTRFNDMKDTNFTGFRLGAQYISDDRDWGLGASYRSEVDLSLEGDAEGQTIDAASTETTLTGGEDSKLSSVFPRQLNIGGFYKYSKRGTAFAEYSWSDYSQNDKIKIEGELLYNGALNVLDGKTVSQNWKDAHAVKLGHEYKFDSWALRSGYAFTSQVTANDSVSITFTAPAVGHTLTIGGGTAFLNDKLFLDFAGEYSWVKGDGTRADEDVSGEYSSSALGLHSSVRYVF